MTSAAANALWLAASLPEAAAFRRACASPAVAQGRVLGAILATNAGTEFGRRHGFGAIRTAAEYRERVPLGGYDDVRAAVERIGAGERNVLTAEPVQVLEPTSGSTAGPKLVPFTASLRRQFRRAVAAWVADLFLRRPWLLRGRSYWSLSPACRPAARTAGGIPIGFADDGEVLGGLAGRVAAATWAVPPSAALGGDLKTFRRSTLLHLLACRELALVSVWSPSFLSLLLAGLDEGDALVASLAAGAGARASPRRVAEVERALGEADAAARHRRLWPRLRLLSCWADAASAGPARHLRGLLPQAELQPKGLVATEGIVSVPLLGRQGAALALRSHFFEFLPEGGGDPVLAHEVEPGRRYSVVLTTGGGLYRYRLGDRVEVVGRLGACPLLHFLGREGVVSDRFGEKLGEVEVQEAVTAALAAQGIEAPLAFLACDADGTRGAYALYVEAPGSGDGALLAAAAAVEEALGARFHYRYCRDLGQLGPVRAFRVAPGGHRAYLGVEAARGRRLGDVKPAVLSLEGEWSRALPGSFVALGSGGPR